MIPQFAAVDDRLKIVTRSQSMTRLEFDREIQRLLNRVDLLREARRGDVRLVAVEVPETTVKRHTRAAHVRWIRPSKPRDARSSRRRR